MGHLSPSFVYRFDFGAVFLEKTGQIILLVGTAAGQHPEAIPGKAFVVARLGIEPRQTGLGDQAR
jgi:hypothetical protein